MLPVGPVDAAMLGSKLGDPLNDIVGGTLSLDDGAEVNKRVGGVLG